MRRGGGERKRVHGGLWGGGSVAAGTRKRSSSFEVGEEVVEEGWC